MVSTLQWSTADSARISKPLPFSRPVSLLGKGCQLNRYSAVAWRSCSNTEIAVHRLGNSLWLSAPSLSKSTRGHQPSWDAQRHASDVLAVCPRATAGVLPGRPASVLCLLATLTNSPDAPRSPSPWIRCKDHEDQLMDGGRLYLGPSERWESWNKQNNTPTMDPPSSPSYCPHLEHTDVGLQPVGKSVEP